MPIIHIEEPAGVWTRREVTYGERRALLMASDPARRFIKEDVVFLAHPSNLWCLISEVPFEEVPWDA